MAYLSKFKPLRCQVNNAENVGCRRFLLSWILRNAVSDNCNYSGVWLIDAAVTVLYFKIH
jgi:hypothetical protein